MNYDKIDLLAQLATDNKGGLDRHKFAELIIQECAVFVDSHEQIDRYGEAQDVVYGEDLLKHFGVEK